jgi:hypothetical protein
VTRHSLSPNFIIEEFDCRDGSEVPARLERDIALLVAVWLQPMRDEFGPLHVVSGYRTPQHNKRVGGARFSVHLLRTDLPARKGGSVAKAAAGDIVGRRPGATPRALAAWARRHRARHAQLGRAGRGGIGEYATFVHVDTGPLRDWRG